MAPAGHADPLGRRPSIGLNLSHFVGLSGFLCVPSQRLLCRLQGWYLGPGDGGWKVVVVRSLEGRSHPRMVDKERWPRLSTALIRFAQLQTARTSRQLDSCIDCLACRRANCDCDRTLRRRSACFARITQTILHLIVSFDVTATHVCQPRTARGACVRILWAYLQIPIGKRAAYIRVCTRAGAERGREAYKCWGYVASFCIVLFRQAQDSLSHRRIHTFQDRLLACSDTLQSRLLACSDTGGCWLAAAITIVCATSHDSERQAFCIPLPGSCWTLILPSSVFVLIQRVAFSHPMHVQAPTTYSQ
jgi:hypothetical protein